MTDINMVGTPTITEIAGQLRERSKELLIQLQGFKRIEEEYRLTSRALKVLTGESNGQGRPKGSKNGTGTSVKSAGNKGNKTQQVLQAIADGYTNIAQIRSVVSITPSAFSSACVRLLRKKLIQHAGTATENERRVSVFKITDRGIQSLREPKKIPGKKASKRNGDGIRLPEILKILAQNPNGLNAAGVAEAVGRPELKSKISTQLPYMAVKKLAVSNKGVYTLTSAGKKQVAEAL